MNWDRIEGNWKQFKGSAKEQWGKLTDDQLDMAAGRRDKLVGKIQETYGITKEESEEQVSIWLNAQKETQKEMKRVVVVSTVTGAGVLCRDPCVREAQPPCPAAS